MRHTTSAAETEASVHALILSALPVIRIGIAALIRSEFGAQARVLGVDWGPQQHDAFAKAETPFNLLVAHWRGDLHADELARLAAAAPDAALLVAYPRQASALRAQLPTDRPRWILLDAMPDEWRRVLRSSLLRPAGGEALTALQQRLPPNLLTRRQVDVFHMVGAGYSNKAIAEKLGLSVGTVKLHVAAILRALNAHRRIDIVLRRAGMPPALRSPGAADTRIIEVEAQLAAGEGRRDGRE